VRGFRMTIVQEHREGVRDDAVVHRRSEQPFLRVPRQIRPNFSAACPNSEANRSSSVSCDAWKDGASGSLDLFCGRPSTSASGAESGRFPPAWREPSSASLPSPTISATICLAVPTTVSFALIGTLTRCLWRCRRRSLRTPLPSPCWRRLKPERPRPERCRPAAASPS